MFVKLNEDIFEIILNKSDTKVVVEISNVTNAINN